MSTPTTSAETQFAELYATFLPRVEGYIAKRLPRRDSQLAQDLAAEVFTSLWRGHYTQGRPIGEAPWGLLATVAQRRVADHFRLARNQREFAADMSATFANRNLTPAASGACEVVNTGFRTARIGGAK
jgi:DNA-directed RNA polymerase specialized sigma24 family protein